MLIYSATKGEFIDHVLDDTISDHILAAYQNKTGKTTSQSEIRSWHNSMQYMSKVLTADDIPNECGIAIEFKVPSTSKRIDFIITGFDALYSETAIIIELKQWDSSQLVNDKDGIIKTIFNGRLIETTHPSYQVWSYANMIENYNASVQDYDINIYPTAYLHNYILKDNDDLIHSNYDQYINLAPIHARGDAKKLREFIKQHVKFPDHKKILYRIENGKIRPSKSLQDSLVSMLQKNDEFIMIDDQKVIFETAKQLALDSFNNNQKNVLIVEGGPGTGKTVLAINLLVKLMNENMVCNFVSKNSAIRDVYQKKLQSNFRKTEIRNLFRGSGSFYQSSVNEIDVLLVDEAHRLNEKSGMFKNLGENQTMEIIKVAKFSVFFIDENQRVTLADACKKDDIYKFADMFNANITYTKLESQFRCNGSDGYISWLNDLLGISNTANFDSFDFDYDIKVCDTPQEMEELIRTKNKINNKSRIVAGYCWEWKKEYRNNTDHKDILIAKHDYGISWNLGNSTTWAIDEQSVNQSGCIHTTQGLEFDYVGVIIGPDIKFEGGKIVTDHTKRAKTDQSLKGIKTLYKTNKYEAIKTADEIIKNTYKTLMTRGQKGCYIYCYDDNLAKYVKDRINILLKIN